MSLADNLINIRNWIQEHICDKVKLKAPDEEQQVENYEYKLVTPAAFIQFLPAKDILPEYIKDNFPSVCIRLVEGEHKEGLTTMQLMLQFNVWNPGIHAKDIFTPINDNHNNGYTQNTEGQFKRTAEGWQDAINFVDVALREIENAESINGLRVLSEEGIKYGFTDETLEGNYPYWFAWITFSVHGGNIRARAVENFL